jgi:histidine triad (HIT) family protein
MSSIFTQIINGDIPANKIYEDEHTLAFLDIRPSQPGHTLVVPKTEIEFIWDLPATEYQALMVTVQKVGAHMRQVLEVPYVGIKVVGTEVPHVHVHLVPFATVGEYIALPDPNKQPDFAALDEMAQKLAM